MTFDGIISDGPPTYSHVLVVTGSRTFDDVEVMRAAFNDVWALWTAGPQGDGGARITSPVLLSGHAAGADTMAERLCRQAGFAVATHPARWDEDGVAAGPRRNQRMIEQAMLYQQRGAAVIVAAFLQPCTSPNCRQQGRQQLLPTAGGHFSHGTVDCRVRARRAGLKTLDVLPPNMARAADGAESGHQPGRIET